MISTAGPVENPFPARAVATFGVRTDLAADFEYMRKARAYAIDYLKNYPNSGGGVALSGGHGSGKTLLVTWLGDEANKIKSRESRTVYAKADSESVLELYRQVLKNITRLALIKVTRKAVLNLGGERAGAARATQSTSFEIESARDLRPAFEQKVLDPNEVYLLLQNEIEQIGTGSSVSQRIAYAIGVLEHPDFGEAAFNWLAGDTPQLPIEMPLPLQSSLWPQDSIGAADIAVSALECVSGLFRLAEIPLIIILDQMENFVPAGISPLTQASALKKLVEQLSGQAALILMAGTPVAWDRLPRDVGPRFLTRAPLIVGGLTAKETDLLLKSYSQGEHGFTPEAVETIRELSGGGNTREILQIAHRVFRETNGAVSRANNDLLIKAAKDSGTLADREILALQMIDTAAERLKLTTAPASRDDGQKIDRMVAGPSGDSLAIVLLTSSDARAEAEDARKLTSLRKKLASDSEQRELLIVTVGYSSPRIRELIREISHVVVFEENEFQKRIERELSRISGLHSTARNEKADISPALEQLAKLDERLARIEETRKGVERRTSQTLAQGAAKLGESERLSTEGVTRYELRIRLDGLHDALTRGEDSLERQIMRQLLVANEAYVKDSTFDYLGNVYLDALDSVKLAMPFEVRDPPIIVAYTKFRSDLILTMRGALSGQARSRFVLNPFFCSGFVGLFAAVCILSIPSVRAFYNLSGEYIAAFGLVLTGIIAGIVYLPFDLLFRPSRRYRYLAWRLERLRSGAIEN
jgi:hypothetical protein